MTVTRRTLLSFVALPALLPLTEVLTGRALAAPGEAGTLRFSLATEANTLVPIDNTFGVTGVIGPKINEGLLTYDLDFEPVPQLAEAWDVGEDGLSYSFRLREGVTWHDGQPFTSADVAYSILTLREVHPRGRATFANVTGVETPDALTAVIRLAKPAPYLLKALAAAESPIVAKHVYDVGVEVGKNPANAAPIGTGPFVFKEWVKGSHILLERNPAYWGEGQPHLEQIVVRIIQDPNARSLAFSSGELDLGGDTPVPRSDIPAFEANPEFEVTSDGYAYLGNQSQLLFNLEHPILSSRDVRHAIAHALDPQAILDVAWYGQGVLSPTPISPVLTEFHNPDIKPYPQDLARAAELLDAAGHPVKDGQRFALRITHNPFSDGNGRAASYIQQALAPLGIRVEIESFDFAGYVKTVYTDRAFDLSVENLSNAFDPTVGVQRGYWSRSFKPGLPFSNGSGYRNPEVDALLEAAAVENDPNKRRALFFRFQEIVAEDLPVVNFLSYYGYTIARTGVTGHTVTIDGPRANFADVAILSS